MKLSKPQFEALQREWYEKLKQEGFDDCENLVGAEMYLKQFSTNILHRKKIKLNEAIIQDKVSYTDKSCGQYVTNHITNVGDSLRKYMSHESHLYIQDQTNYFRLIGMFINDPDTKFRKEVDRIIMLRHSEGAKIATICLELKTWGMKPWDRKSIRILIRRYEMAWGLRTYNRKQLNKKDKV